MTISLSLNAWMARDDDEAWERLLEGAWGIDARVALVVLLGAAAIAGVFFGPLRTGNSTRALLVGAGATAGTAGLGMVATHLLARPSGIGQLVIPTQVAVGAIVVSGLVALGVALAFRQPPSLRAWTASWAIALALIAIVPAAAFDDNSAGPTPWPISLIVLAAIVAIGVANPAGRRERAGLVALVALIVWLRWIVDDSVACTDDDCLPLPFSVAWTSVGGLLLGTAWWRRDLRLRPQRTAATGGSQG